MKLCSFFAIGVLASATCVWGVDEVVKPAVIKTAPAVDREAFVARIAESKEAMKEQERVVSEVATDFFSLDKEREAKIQRVVTLLSGLRDSVDTRTQITDAKDKAIAALGKSFTKNNAG